MSLNFALAAPRGFRCGRRQLLESELSGADWQQVARATSHCRRPLSRRQMRAELHSCIGQPLEQDACCFAVPLVWLQVAATDCERLANGARTPNWLHAFRLSSLPAGRLASWNA